MKKLNIFTCLSAMAVLSLAPASLNAQDYSEYDGAEVAETEFVSTAATSTVSGDELYKTATANLGNTFVGKFSGMTVKEGTGEFGNDGAGWIIRGVGSYGVGSWNSAKLFVDGFEVNSEYVKSLSPAEIESVSVLKDAAALAIYGERGANGVISITTKRGTVGKANVSARLRYGVQNPTSINKPLDSYDYATLYNQAVSNDNGMVWTPAYSADQIAAYQNGKGVNVDWYDQVLAKSGQFIDGDVILNGGSANARYNINLNYMNNAGLLDVANTDYTKNLGYQKYNLRANLDFNVLKIFEVKLDIGGRIETVNRPNYGISSLFNDLANYPSNVYNVYDNVEEGLYSGTAVYPNNPYASANALGWVNSKARTLQVNFSVKERLDMILKGLYLQEAVSLYSYTLSGYSKTRNYARWMNGATTTTDETTTITASGYGSNGMQDWKQGRVTLGYDTVKGQSTVNAALNFNVSAYKGDVASFSYKYNTLNLNGFVHYDFAHKYIGEVSFSYFGNDAYAPGHRWAVYPAVSGAWIISNEDFLKGSEAVNNLKLRASVGLSGSSDSGSTGSLSSFSSNGRFLFKDYYTNSYVGSFYTGNPGGWQTTYVPMFITNENAHAEKSLKYNIGVDATLFKHFDLSVDAYLDKRSDILTLENSLMGYYGKQYSIANVGKMTSWGTDVTARWFGKSGDFSWNVNGMLSFNRNRVDYMAEVAPANAFSAQTGRPYGSLIGLVADGFYGVDDFDANGDLKAGSAVPAFGNVQPGDIKYLDLDKNGIVDQNDVTRIGRSQVPEWYFSFGGNVAWKGFDLEVLFQGAAGADVNILNNWNQTVAFVNNNNAYAIAKGAWAYYPAEGIDNRANATYPRLTTQSNENNYQLSSFWVKEASFLKLRNVELGYTFNTKASKVENLRVFVNAHNLCTFSSLLKNYNLDPENVAGLYPMLKSVNAGVTITF